MPLPQTHSAATLELSPGDDEMLELGRWHDLFDELCNRAGYFDNAALAAEYCRRIGKNGGVSFDAMQKNLRHWRQGQRLPLRRNAMVLAQLLAIQPGSALQQHWTRLYAIARGEMPASPSTPALPLPPPVERSPKRSVSRWALLSAGALAIAGLSFAAVERWRFEQHPFVDFTNTIKMTVGDSRLINGQRYGCGRYPADWYYVLWSVPLSTLGEFSDGGVARKWSDACNKIVAVRAARFTARRAGIEQLNVMGDLMRIEIVRRADGRD